MYNDAVKSSSCSSTKVVIDVPPIVTIDVVRVMMMTVLVVFEVG